MRRLSPALLTLGLAAGFLPFLASHAAAQGLGVRLTPEGLDVLADVAESFLPSRYATSDFDTVVFNCPAGARMVSGHVPPTDISLNFDGLDLRSEDGQLVVSTRMDVALATEVFLENPYACFGEATCDVSAAIDDLAIDVVLAAGTAAGGGVEFHSAMIDLNLSAEDLNMESEGCAVGEVATWLLDTFEDWALEQGIPRLEAALTGQVTTLLSELVNDTLSLQVELAGLRIDGSLSALDSSASTGLTAGGDVALEWVADLVWEEDAPETQEATGSALPADFGPGMFQLAVSDRVVTRALYEAWRGGMIKRLLAAPLTSIELAGDGIVQQIGLQPGTEMTVLADIERPLEVVFGREAPGVAEVIVRDLHVEIIAEAPSGTSRIDVFVDGRVQANVAVSTALGGLVLDLGEMSIESLSIEAGNTDVRVDRARIGAFIERTVTPMMNEMLGGVPVAPALNPVILGSFVEVRSLDSDGGWQRIGLDLVRPNPGDSTPPATFLDALNNFGAGTVAFYPTGSDNATPESLLRFVATLDGETVGDGTPSGLRAVYVDVTDGEHVIEIAAVDLNGNEDPTPVRHEFSVDGTPPVLTVLDSPSNIVEGSISARWEASDDDGAPVESRWEVRRVGAESVRIAGTEFGADAFDMTFSDLAEGDLYELEIIVRDSAGNVASESFAFATNPGGGCSAGGNSSNPLWLLCLGFLLFRRRN